MKMLVTVVVTIVVMIGLLLLAIAWWSQVTVMK